MKGMTVCNFKNLKKIRRMKKLLFFTMTLLFGITFISCEKECLPEPEPENEIKIEFLEGSLNDNGMVPVPVFTEERYGEFHIKISITAGEKDLYLSKYINRSDELLKMEADFTGDEYPFEIDYLEIVPEHNITITNYHLLKIPAMETGILHYVARFEVRSNSGEYRLKLNKFQFTNDPQGETSEGYAIWKTLPVENIATDWYDL
jgi:hypothetical protein